MKKTIPKESKRKTVAEILNDFSLPILEKKDRVRRCISKYGADLNRLSIEGDPPLVILCELGWSDLVDEWLSNPLLEVNAVNSDGLNALMMATQKNHYEIVKSLCEHGVDLNAVSTFDQMTALMMAEDLKDRSIADLLLKFGADPKNKIQESNTMTIAGGRKL